MVDEIVELINFIGKAHEKFSNTFFMTHASMNLKRTTIKNIIIENTYDSTFQTLLDNYIEELSLFLIFNTFDSKHPFIETRFRGKTKESVLNKIYHYRFGKQKGEIPIQKTLNDLLGFRLILNSTQEYQNLLEELKTSNKIKVKLFRPYFRADEGYRAIHLYFKSGNNNYFPWELQIWNKIDEKSNEYSHRYHKAKRQYMNWTKIYKKNKHREE